MDDRHTGGCIYCGRPGPFTDEHVISAGLGGDDDQWLLKDCVCAKCNTTIFSKLETKFLRSSPVAIARLFLQDRTRDRGKNTSSPSMQPKLTVYRDIQTGFLLAAQLKANGETLVLPQIIAFPQTGGIETAVTGSELATVVTFLNKLDDLLVDQLTLITKRREGYEVVFDVTTLLLIDDAYKIGTSSAATKPPQKGVWIEPLTLPATARPNDRLPLAVFELPTGQLVCRSGSIENAAVLLGFLRQNPQIRRLAKAEPEIVSDTSPGVHLRITVDLAAYDRVFTKIGLNLCGFLLGLDLVRGAEFDGAVAYAKDGTGAVYKAPASTGALFGPPLPNHHILMLSPAPGAVTDHAIVFMAQLYGGPIERFRLAEFEQPIASLTRPIVVHVDYQNHRIERLTLEEHVARVAAIFGDWTTQNPSP